MPFKLTQNATFPLLPVCLGYSPPLKVQTVYFCHTHTPSNPICQSVKRHLSIFLYNAVIQCGGGALKMLPPIDTDT